MHQKEFVAKDGLTYTIKLDATGEEISVLKGTELIGVIDLKRVINPRGSNYYLITVLDLEKCKRIGLGEASLRYHQEVFRLPLTANGDIGEGRRSSKGQMTREGIVFIQKMRAKEVIEAEDFHNAFSEDE
ncbi:MULTISPECIES: hypothetical protein [unclassified Methylophilus]|jgi:hypothetical protein|uniref:hypothetical protein n=1 Tax=unclassified Methylophilus TaxID=2630143 RepID=UPI0006F3F3BD|nr:MULTISPECIES: hypothetical protein [unclassified Methylophilus]KQT36309.1 hypothetical protein ASG24_08635 [Methylophilus sp. Leaf414]